MSDGAVETIREALDRARLDLSHPARGALHALESQNQALQERAEKAEARIEEALAFGDDPWSTSSHYRIGWQDAVRAIRRLLSPTQETDEPDCARCGNERTVGGYGTDERFPCPVCRPTQETDPCGIRNDQLVCNLPRGHEGDHRDQMPGGPAMTWPTQEIDPE